MNRDSPKNIRKDRKDVPRMKKTIQAALNVPEPWSGKMVRALALQRVGPWFDPWFDPW